MESQALSATGLRLIIALVGIVVLALIYFFGRPSKPGQGRRRLFRRTGSERIEPTLGGAGDAAEGEPEQREFELGADEPDVQPARSTVGTRPDQPIERIVTLYVSARGEQQFAGPDLVVAAEKAGLEFGVMGIFHRPLAGKAQAGPVFSMASMVKPGSFDMARLETIRTPGVSLFMTLPGPLSALDAWDTMLPTAQRLAELLDGVVLDEGRNALGRQRIAHIRDELRLWDRKHEGADAGSRW
jgi:cell division protein ZipA